MAEAGIKWRPCDPWQGEPFPPLEEYDAVLALGGPQQTDEEHLHPWLADEKALLRDAVAQGLPVLGVCLGCQLLADASRRHRGAADQGRGRYPRLHADRRRPRRPALRGRCPRPPLTLQWHLNAVTALPAHARLLASSPACAIQAFRLGSRAYGVQFHMEVDAALVRATEAFPTYIAALERQEGDGAFARVVAETERWQETLRANGRQLFRNFVGLMDAGDGRRPAA